MKGLTVSILLLVCFNAAGAEMSATEQAEAREDIQKSARSVLDDLYQVSPEARQSIANAAGYAVFRNFGMKIFVMGGGKGSGLAVNNRSGEKVYMKMLEMQAGLGFGAKKFNLVWVFEDAQDLNSFTNSGWELGGQATLAAESDSTGGASFAGAMSVKPGVWLYQITEAGLAAELTAKGTKYFKDDELN
jgi:lipid-binding SYLF domain-containing protein